MIFYLLPQIGVTLRPIHAAIIGLAMNYSAYEAEIYRAGILAVPRGQMEAALALGMSTSQAVRRIILPQAMRIVIPPVTNDFIALFKDTSVCSVITVMELTGPTACSATTRWPRRVGGDDRHLVHGHERAAGLPCPLGRAAAAASPGHLFCMSLAYPRGRGYRDPSDPYRGRARPRLTSLGVTRRRLPRWPGGRRCVSCSAVPRARPARSTIPRLRRPETLRPIR